MKAWLTYAGAGVLVIGAGLLVASFFLTERAYDAAWRGGVIAYVVQLVAFAALLRARGRTERAFLLGWAGGIALRFGAVLGTGLLLKASDTPLGPVLISLVAFLFVLALLEPLFLRMAE